MDGRKDPIVSWNEENVGGRCGRWKGRKIGKRRQATRRGQKKRSKGRKETSPSASIRARLCPHG